MEIAKKNQFNAPQEITDALSKKSEDFEAKHAMARERGGVLFEDKEFFCRKKNMEFLSAMNQSQEKLAAGLAIFMQKDNPDFPVERVFQHIARLQNIQSDAILQKTVKDVLEISDEDYLTMYNIAAEALNQQNYAEASDMFVVLSWLNPKIYHASMNYALAEALQDRRREAQQMYEYLLTFFAEVPELHFYAADNCYMMEDYEKAEGFLEVATRVANEEPNEALSALIDELTQKINVEKTQKNSTETQLQDLMPEE